TAERSSQTVRPGSPGALHAVRHAPIKMKGAVLLLGDPVFRRGARIGRPMAALVAMFAVVIFGTISLVGRWRISGHDDRTWLSVWESRDDTESMDRTSMGAVRGGRRSGELRLPVLPTHKDDPRLEPLRRAAESWRQMTGPHRVVVDQVCLVPDVPSFF